MPMAACTDALSKQKKGALGMKNLLAFSALTLIAVSAFGQGMGQRRMFYDPSTLTTISGTVRSVDTLTGRGGNFQMIQLTVKDSSGTIPVHIGPAFYLDQQGISFKAGGAVEITGSQMQFNGNDFIAAAEVKYDGKTITLRDDSGRPVWARRRMR
jgi:hypothetical protein